MDVSDVEVSGLRVSGATAQGIWVQGGARVHLSGLDVASNLGAGLSAKGAAGLIVEASSITGNAGAGILELAGTRDARYADNEIRGNGIGGATYNGDGIQLGGTGADVIANTITANGSSTFEHGIYTGAASAGWTIELNTLADNAGANVKATGGPGLIRRNRMTNGTFGLILSDNPAPVTAEHNVISGRAQHVVLLTSATTSARGRLWANTVVQYGRSTSSGDASAVFVIAATSLELRDNLLCYAGDGHRTNLAGWRTSSGQDARSLTSWAPQFDVDQRVTSANWGIARGDDLGLLEDFAGAPPPAGGRVDIGAYQAA